ncbi:MAG: hypothetical protein NTV22_15485 [bacterium]|nr:hypothetical protein [bacterium]
MKLQTAMSITQSKSFQEWKSATTKAVGESKSAGHDPADVLRCMNSEITAMLVQINAAK